jgi:hypothetical protein
MSEKKYSGKNRSFFRSVELINEKEILEDTDGNGHKIE